MLAGSESQSLLHAPALAAVQRLIYSRPQHLADRPLAIDRRLWEDACEQLRAILAARGWPLSCADPKECPAPNFLLGGVPIIMDGV